MKRPWLLILGVVVLSILIFYRAAVMPFTHDEASTWINYRHLNVWSCLYNSACWGSANNHWLNTLLLQWSADLFGEQPLALRLPNVVAGVLYLAGAAAIVRKYLTPPVIQLSGFLLLTAHLYLLDFFSLARGYGLMACGVLWGMYALLEYTDGFRWRWLLVCVTALILAVLANFTALLPWATLGVAWAVGVLYKKHPRLLLSHGSVWLASAFILFFLLRFPITSLSGSGEFEWGAQDLWAMMTDLTINLLYNSYYINRPSTAYFIWGFGLVLLLILLISWLTRNSRLKDPLRFSLMWLALGFLVIFLQMTLTGAQAPVGRKSIYLIPFLFLPVALALGLIRHAIAQRVVGIVLVLLLVFQAGKRLRPKECREWYYDAYYPQLFSVLFPDGANSDSVRLGASWIFYPALMYYQQTDSLPFSGLEYHKQLKVDTTLQYYFTDPGDTTGLSANGYILDQRFGPFLLFRGASSVPSTPGTQQ